LGYVHCIIEVWSVGDLYGFLVPGWLLPSRLANSSTLPKFICPLLFLNPSSPHYNPYKVLLIVLCTLHFSSGEFESFGKHMVEIFGMSLEWTYVMFQTYELERFIFSLKWGSTSLFSSNQFLCAYMTCYMVLRSCSSLISACALLLLWKPSPPSNFKMFCVLFGVAIACYFACDMLWLAYFKEVVVFLVLDASPLIRFL